MRTYRLAGLLALLGCDGQAVSSVGEETIDASVVSSDEGKFDVLRPTDQTSFNCTGLRHLQAGPGELVHGEGHIEIEQRDWYQHYRFVHLIGSVVNVVTSAHRGLRIELTDDDIDSTSRLRLTAREANTFGATRWVIIEPTVETPAGPRTIRLDTFDFIEVQEHQGQLVVSYRGASSFEPDTVIEGEISFSSIPALAGLEEQPVLWGAFGLPARTWIPLDRLDGNYEYEVAVTCPIVGGCLPPTEVHSCWQYPTL